MVMMASAAVWRTAASCSWLSPQGGGALLDLYSSRAWARFCSVMSRSVLAMATGRPVSSLSAVAVTQTSRIRPSLVLRWDSQESTRSPRRSCSQWERTRREQLFGNHLLGIHLQRLGFAVAEHLLGAAVPGGDFPVKVVNGDRIVRIQQDGGQPPRLLVGPPGPESHR